MLAKPAVFACTPNIQDADHDCACPDGGLSPALPYIAPYIAAAWQIAPDLMRTPLDEEHTLLFNPTGQSGPVVVNSSAARLFDSFRRARRLDGCLPVPGLDPEQANDAVIHLIELGLLQPVGSLPPLERRTPRTLTAWLHTTNACNLRCSYCYIDKSAEPMTEETGRQAVDAVFRSALAGGFRAVKLKYAGGESTLNFRLVMHLHDYALSLAQKHGLDLRATVLSNGVALTRPLLQFLREESIRLSISLDGVGATHDRQRAFVNGSGSFAHVQRGIDRALDADVTPFLSITVTAESADDLPAAVAFALDRDLPFNLNFYRDHSISASLATLRADNERLIAGMRSAFAVIEERLPRRRLIDSLVDRSAFHEPHEYACGAGHNYLVIDQNGGVSACQMEIDQPLSHVLAENPLDEIRLHSGGVSNLPVSEKEGCRECDWRFWCAGGCSLLTQRVTGRSDIRSPYCEVYKALYPDILRLEGLRLLRWQTALH